MKTTILLLTLGIVGVIANPVSKQTIQSENKNSFETDISDSQTKQEEVINTANKGDQKQKEDKLVEKTEPPNTDDTYKKDETVEIVIEETFDSLKDHLSEECDHGQNTPVETPKINPDSKKDNDGTVEIIIEENLVDSIDENSQQIFADAPLSPGFNENVPPMPGTFEMPQNPQFPGFIGDSPPVPQFVAGSQVMGEFLGGPQYSGFIERPQLPGLIGGIPQMPGFIEEGPLTPFNDNAQEPDDDENNIIAEDYFSEDMEKIEHEIMETAAGFVPTPLVFRRKQKPRRRFTTRRHFRRNPYRRHQIFYPYYYAYYRPSSLRYY